MQLTNNLFMDSRLNYLKSAMERQSAASKISNGVKIDPRSDSGALSSSLKLQTDQVQLTSKMTSVQNTLSYLQTQSGVINQAKAILERFAELRIKFDDITLNETDRNNLNKEFSELSDQLESLKYQKFNGISLFSNTGSGNGLYDSLTKSVNSTLEHSFASNITNHALDIEDIRYLNEAGEAVKSGFGGLEVAYFPASDSQKQMETITISGSVAEGDEFFFNVREQTAMLETESENSFRFVADNATENAGDPQEVVRDALYDDLMANANIANFLDVQKVGTNEITLTSKMKGDPYLLHSYGSSGTAGSIVSNANGPATWNDTQEDRLRLELPGVNILAGDSVSVDIDVGGTTQTFTHTATANISPAFPGEDTASSLISGLRSQINASTGVTAAFQPGQGNNELYIFSNDRGTGFTASNLQLNLADPTSAAASSSLSTRHANNPGAGTYETIITIGNDDTSPGGGQVPIGDTYQLLIQERHPDERGVDNDYGLTRGMGFASFTSTTNADQTKQIRDRLLTQLTTARTFPNFSNNGTPSFNVDITGLPNNQLRITGAKVGDPFRVTAWVSTTPDDLDKTVNAENISPFSIEKSIEYLDSMMAQNNAEQARMHKAHDRLQDRYVSTETARGRIEDADYAQESTKMVRGSLKMQMASEVMSNVTRMKDILIPLTTEHHRGSILKAGIL